MPSAAVAHAQLLDEAGDLLVPDRLPAALARTEVELCREAKAEGEREIEVHSPAMHSLLETTAPRPPAPRRPAQSCISAWTMCPTRSMRRSEYVWPVPTK